MGVATDLLQLHQRRGVLGERIEREIESEFMKCVSVLDGEGVLGRNSERDGERDGGRDGERD